MKDKSINIKINEGFQLASDRFGTQILVSSKHGQYYVALQAPYSMDELIAALRTLADRLSKTNA